MKPTHILSLSLTLSACLIGCRSFSPEEQVAATTSLDSRHVGSLAPPPPAISSKSKFVAACPYDDLLAVSKSCLTTGAATVAGGNEQTWTITFVCRRCGYVFTDTRTQILPYTTSLQLPIRTIEPVTQ